MSADAFDSYQRTRAFGALDGLRCLSILVVVWHHSPVRLSWWTASNLGFLGVDLFFVISGFLIVTLMLRERERNGDISLPKFYMRRTLRIFPLYYGLILFLSLYYVTLGADSSFGSEFLADLPIYLCYLGNFFPVGFGIVWSLAAEEQFYLAWPLIERNLRRFIVPILAVAIGINQLFNFKLPRAWIEGWLGGAGAFEGLGIVQCTFTPILLGVCLAHLFQERRSFERCAPLFASRFAPVGWALALVALAALVSETNIAGWGRLSVQLLMAGLVGSAVYREDHLLMPLLRFRPFVRIGTVSYGIYLLHIHAIELTKRFMGLLGVTEGLLIFVVAAGLAILLAELSFRFWETPFLRLKGRFASSTEQAQEGR